MKTLLNKIQMTPEMEALLLPRLKFIAYLLLSFSFAAFCYALFEEEEWILNEQHSPAAMREVDPEGNWQLNEILATESTYIVNAYVAAVGFALAGSSTLLYATKRKKVLDLIPIKEESEDPPL